MSSIPARVFPVEPVDVLVIGGGITGAAVARDAALRGLSVTLIERDDFGGATSSRTSKLIHGGLRYLEHGHVRLVFEACRERRLLLQNAPHLVQPMDFLIPIYSGGLRSRGRVAAGLWLYDALAVVGGARDALSRSAGVRRAAGLRRHRMVSADQAVGFVPALCRDGLQGGALYADCRMRDARLCVDTALDAQRRGAFCYNRVAAEGLLWENRVVAGVSARDRLTGARHALRARVVVNAAGPWADAMASAAGVTRPVRIRPSRGSHIVVRSLGLSQAILLSAGRDGRVVFVIPWEGQTLIGTTEDAMTDVPEDVRASREDVRYLLDEVNRVMPGAGLTEQDVRGTFAGIRPLVDAAGRTLNETSRSHVIFEEPAGLVHIYGGKYTTHRAIAEQAVDMAARRLVDGRGRGEPLGGPGSQGRSGSREFRARGSDRSGRRFSRCRTARTPLWSVDDAPDAYARRVVRMGPEHVPAGGHGAAVSEASLHYLAVTYGVRHRDVLALATSDPQLARPLSDAYPSIGAELVYAVRHEHAQSLTDVAFRRTSLGFCATQGLDALEGCAAILRRHLGWEDDDIRRDVALYRRIIAEGSSWREEVRRDACPGSVA